jgi:DNA gyrase inhibitor GyrI
MSELDVRIVQLAPMRVLSAYGFGESPEAEAWQKLLAFVQTRGLLDGAEKYRFFGFNNPNPAPGSPNYGYEQWITVGLDVIPEGDLELKDFSGGRYAVLRSAGVHTIAQDWQALATWREDSQYEAAHHQWLEELLTSPTAPFEEFAFDLFLPIAE